MADIPTEYVVGGFVAMAGALTWLGVWLRSTVKAQERRCATDAAECRKENARAWGKVEERDEQIKQLTIKSIAAQADTASALHNLSEAIRGSGPQVARQ